MNNSPSGIRAALREGLESRGIDLSSQGGDAELTVLARELANELGVPIREVFQQLGKTGRGGTKLTQSEVNIVRSALSAGPSLEPPTAAVEEPTAATQVAAAKSSPAGGSLPPIRPRPTPTPLGDRPPGSTPTPPHTEPERGPMSLAVTLTDDQLGQLTEHLLPMVVAAVVGAVQGDLDRRIDSVVRYHLGTTSAPPAASPLDPQLLPLVEHTRQYMQDNRDLLMTFKAVNVAHALEYVAKEVQLAAFNAGLTVTNEEIKSIISKASKEVV